MGEGRPSKSHWHIQCHAACHPTSEKILGRCDHHYVVWGWQVWLCQPEPLLGNQVGTDRFHQDTLHRTGRIRYPCQCDPARRRRESENTESSRGPCETERQIG